MTTHFVDADMGSTAGCTPGGGLSNHSTPSVGMNPTDEVDTLAEIRRVLVTVNRENPVGPCPAWCHEPPGHRWAVVGVYEGGDYGRYHEATIAEGICVYWAEVPGQTEGLTPSVQVIIDDRIYRSRAAVEKLITDLREAARVAFGSEADQ